MVSLDSLVERLKKRYESLADEIKWRYYFLTTPNSTQENSPELRRAGLVPTLGLAVYLLVGGIGIFGSPTQALAQTNAQQQNSSVESRILASNVNAPQTTGGQILDYAYKDGHFYTQTNGGQQGGFFVSGKVQELIDVLGGVYVTGFPIAHPYIDEEGWIYIPLQRLNLQIASETNLFKDDLVQLYREGKINFDNVFDELSAAGKDSWLEAYKQIPKAISFPEDDPVNDWEGTKARHLNILESQEGDSMEMRLAKEAIRQEYYSDPEWLNHYGLPMAINDYGPFITARFNRVAMQHIKTNLGWANKGDVKLVLGADLLKEAGLITITSATPRAVEEAVAYAIGMSQPQRPDVISVPPQDIVDRLGLDTSFYKKYLDANGVSILGSDKVKKDEVFYSAREIVNEMFFTIPDIKAAMINRGFRITLMAESEVVTDIPETRDIYLRAPIEKYGIDWNKVTGLGAILRHPELIASDGTLYCDGTPRKNGRIVVLVHEVGHSVMDMGLRLIEGGNEIINEIKENYRLAKAEGLWDNTSLLENDEEYWANGVEIYFDASNQNKPGVHNHINTNEELRGYDPRLYSLISQVFRNNQWRYRCPKN